MSANESVPYFIHDPEAYEAAGRPEIVVLAAFVARKATETGLAHNWPREVRYQNQPIVVELPEAA